MRLVNEAAVPAHLFVVNLLEPKLRAAVIVKKTYDLGADGKLKHGAEQLPLLGEQLSTTFGTFHGELYFRKRGADVCVLGTARFNEPVKQARVRLDIGSFHHELQLLGDRHWQRGSDGALTPSAAGSFTEMPLSYARAFGGTAKIHFEDVAWPDNPVGRGYCDSAGEALDKPLPNIEAKDASAQCTWEERRPVVGWAPYPMYWGLRAARAVSIDQSSGEILDITPELFNHAHPDLILDKLEPGSWVRITGMRPQPIHFVVPTERPRVQVRLGKQMLEVWGELDGMFVWVDASRVVFTWRARFQYEVRPEEQREATLSMME